MVSLLIPCLEIISGTHVICFIGLSGYSFSYRSFKYKPNVILLWNQISIKGEKLLNNWKLEPS
jgi:hypothetical protein